MRTVDRKKRDEEMKQVAYLFKNFYDKKIKAIREARKNNNETATKTNTN